jgi:O-acetyl-ADP-ribose deacetylase (regulator of RNase III)
VALSEVIQEKQISSIAVPPLGCGNGGLNWSDVRPLVEEYLGDLTDVEIIVYEPPQEDHRSRDRA